MLCQTDVGAVGGEVVKEAVDVDVEGGVDQGPCRADEFGVVEFAGEVEGYLLHVGVPVDFGVCDRGEGVSLDFLEG